MRQPALRPLPRLLHISLLSLAAGVALPDLLDKKYYRTVGFYDSVFWGEPRNISLAVRTAFQEPIAVGSVFCRDRL